MYMGIQISKYPLFLHSNFHFFLHSGLGDSMEVDGGAVSLPLLQERFSLEHTNLYMKIATIARQQSNYAVCRKYLGLTERAIKEVCLSAVLAFLSIILFEQFFPGNSKLRLDWLRSVAEMRIQQAEQDPSPTKIEPLVALLDSLGWYYTVLNHGYIHVGISLLRGCWEGLTCE